MVQRQAEDGAQRLEVETAVPGLEQVEIVLPGDPRIEKDFRLQIGDIPSGERRPVEADAVPLRWNPVDGVQQGGLAGPVESDDSVDPAALQGEVELGKDGMRPVGDGQIIDRKHIGKSLSAGRHRNNIRRSG